MHDHLIRPGNEDAIEEALKAIDTLYAVLCYANGKFVKALPAADRLETDVLQDEWQRASPGNATRLRSRWFGNRHEMLLCGTS